MSHRRTRRPLALVLTACALVLAACGGDDPARVVADNAPANRVAAYTVPETTVPVTTAIDEPATTLPAIDTSPSTEAPSVAVAGEPAFAGDDAWTEAAAFDLASGLVNPASVTAYNSYLSTTSPAYANDPASVAQVFAGFDPAAGKVVVVDAGGGAVTVTHTRVFDDDDSSTGVRYVIELTATDSGSYEILSGLQQFRCVEGRGQSDFAPGLCT